MIAPNNASWVWSGSSVKDNDTARSLCDEETLLTLEKGSEVAIIPGANSPPAEAEELATVERVGFDLIELTDGRLYEISGEAFSLASYGCIVPATDEHRAAVLEREFSR
jgi:hypothetical protein